MIREFESSEEPQKEESKMIRIKRWKPELRRAIMKVRPDYFNWSEEARERYGVDIPSGDRKKIVSVLRNELFSKQSNKCTVVDHDNFLNETILPLTGIGKDCFYLNEYLQEGKTILSYPTLRAYDEDDYRFQEKSRKTSDPTYKGKPYRGSLYLSWAHLFVRDQFTYATLSMAAGFIYSALEEEVSNLIGQLIPHTYKPGRSHG